MAIFSRVWHKLKVLSQHSPHSYILLVKGAFKGEGFVKTEMVRSETFYKNDASEIDLTFHKGPFINNVTPEREGRGFKK